MELIFSEAPLSSVMDSTSSTGESQAITPGLCESQQGLSHDVCGQASMVDISSKDNNKKVAVVGCRVLLGKKAFDLVIANQIAKGDVLGVVKIVGISGTKQTNNLSRFVITSALSTKVEGKR